MSAAAQYDAPMRRPLAGPVLVVLVLCASGLLAGCTSRPEWATCTPNTPRACTTLDGIALGGFTASWPLDVPSCTTECRQPVEVARAAVELKAPNHPALTSIDEFEPDRYALCGETICTVSGYLGVLVFTFSDATSLPLVVSCPGISFCQLESGYGHPR